MMQRLKLPKSRLSFILIGLILALTFVLYNCGSGNWPSPMVPREEGGSGDWYSASWDYRKRITIDSTFVDDELSYFPVLVSTTDTDLQVRAQADGDDILFTDFDTTKLNHEIEKYTSGTGELVAWVQVPSLVSTTDHIIYMYYGYTDAADQQNVTSTWDDNGAGNFKMVQHLWETAVGGGSYDDHLDSTLNNNDGEVAGGVNMDATGHIDGADDFDGSTGTVEVADNSSLNITDAITLEAWVYNDDGQTDIRRVVMKTNAGQVQGYQMDIRTGDGVLNLYISNASWRSINSGTTYIDTDQWVYVAGTWSDATNTATIYKNGTYVTSTTSEDFDGPMSTSSSTLTIGSTNSPTHFFDGRIDEVRISNTVRSAAWIKASFENQTATSTFIDFNTECTYSARPC